MFAGLLQAVQPLKPVGASSVLCQEVSSTEGLEHLSTLRFIANFLLALWHDHD